MRKKTLKIVCHPPKFKPCAFVLDIGDKVTEIDT